jgi:hypothetical protein
MQAGWQRAASAYDRLVMNNIRLLTSAPIR